MSNHQKDAGFVIGPEPVPLGCGCKGMRRIRVRELAQWLTAVADELEMPLTLQLRDLADVLMFNLDPEMMLALCDEEEGQTS